MTQSSISHLEKFPHFLRHTVDLHRVHAPDDPVHDALLEEAQDAALATRTAATRRALHTIHRGFPAGAPAHEQAAYLIRAFSGLRPFGEADHRTAWDVLAETLQHHGRELLASEAEGRGLGNEVWQRILDAHGEDGLREDQVAGEDVVFAFLADWFRHRIQ